MERGLTLSAATACAVADGRIKHLWFPLNPQPSLIQETTDSSIVRWQYGSLCLAPAEATTLLAGQCPYARAGDWRYVREPWRLWDSATTETEGSYHDGAVPKPEEEWMFGFWRERVEYYDKYAEYPCRSAASMPWWAARCGVYVLDVRVKRLAEMTDMEASVSCVDGSRDTFFSEWDRRYAKHHLGVSVNPWVWVLTVDPRAITWYGCTRKIHETSCSEYV